jgi:DUF971 family protein
MPADLSSPHTPTEIKVKRQEKRLDVIFDDGAEFQLPAEFLRVHSPSAEVQGHSPAERQTVGGRRHVGIMNVEPVGGYAIRITFDDTHDTGIYSWETLYKFGLNQERMWADYLADLEKAGLSRDP